MLNYKQYEPYGENMLDLFGLTRQSYIGKEKEPENNLGDHGVRKYDYETGRFNSIDPLFEKYYGWSPYQYSMNNPIWAKDWNGKEIIPINLSGQNLDNFYNMVNNVMDTFKDSPTVMNIMNEALGSKSIIHFYAFSENIVGDNNTRSQLFNWSKSLESYWADRGLALARTLRLDNTLEMKADVLYPEESLNGTYDQSTSIISFIDELMHATNAPRCNIKGSEHLNFYGSLMREIANGTLKLDDNFIYIIEQKYEDAKIEFK